MYHIFLFALFLVCNAQLAWAGNSTQPKTPANLEAAVGSTQDFSNSYLVLFMQGGFGMLEAGMVRAKNTKNILLKNIVATGMGGIAFWLLGFGFAFGKTASNGFISVGNFLLLDLESFSAFAVYWGYAITSATIVGGSLAERTRFTCYLIHTPFIVVFIFPFVSHWIWAEDGWLRKLGDNGVIDTAGGGVVHMVGGMVALVATFVVGPRLGRFDADGKPVPIPGHSFSLAALGCFIIWFGTYGFNSGAVSLLPGQHYIAARTAAATTLGACTGCMVVLWIHRFFHHHYDMNMAINGILSGLTSVAAAGAVIDPWMAVCIAFVGGFIYFGSSKLMLRFQLDDPLDAVAVHFFCGAWSLVAVGFFARKDCVESLYGETKVYGFFFDGGIQQLGIQVLAVIVISAWSFGVAFPLFWALNRFYLLRVEHDVELAGLDNAKHGGSAYPDFQHQGCA
eukprot:TRINITY_DN8441_c0_g1_i1.p1 TRINITY_DN8441_c0_g1~~TRINITY_DN8441_c0_g1_i1.p1  ORF type:complete len:451 (-),score=73.70 TRINITY_DN8441_c0_g1_i1:244-1596(-)